MVSPGLASRWVVVVAMVVLAPVTARADRPAPMGTAQPVGFEQILGTWQAQTADNAYQVRVAWNARTGRYEGVLVRQGVLSQRAGHVLGELCWTFDLAPGGIVLNELWRDGASRRATWRRSGIRFEPSTPPRLIAASTRFVKLAGAAQSNARATVAAAPPRTSGVPGDWGQGLPTVEAIVATAGGSDACDQAARAIAALDVWRDFVVDVSASDVGRSRPSPAAARVAQGYKAAAFERFRYAGPTCDTRRYGSSNEFRTQTLGKVLPPSALAAYAKLRAARAQQVAQRTRPAPPGGPGSPGLPPFSRSKSGNDDRELFEAFAGLIAAAAIAQAVAGPPTPEELERERRERLERERRQAADPDYKPNEYTWGTAAYDRREAEERKARQDKEEERRREQDRQREEQERESARREEERRQREAEH